MVNATNDATVIPTLSFDINIESCKGKYAELSIRLYAMISVDKPAAKYAEAFITFDLSMKG